jgi:tetratricopeptide (TPR) repeat protein
MYRLARATPTIEIPDTVRAVLAARIDRLAPEDKRLLQQAAAVGKDVPFPLLRLIAEESEDALRHRLETLQATEFLREARLFPDLEYTFTHALTHEAVYAGLVHDRRKFLHARIVHAMDQLYADRVTERAEALAYHALRGEVWDRAIDALCLVGGAAYTRGAVTDTLDWYEQALDILPRLPARPETLRRAVDVRIAFFRPLFAMGQITRLTGLVEEAERLARELDDQARLVTVLSLLAACANFDAHYPAASTYGRQALDIAVAIANPSLRLQAASVLAMTHAARGEWQEAIDQLTPQVDGPDATLARELPAVFGSLYAVSCCQLVVCSSYLGCFTDAIRYADLAIAEADAADTPLAQAAAYFHRALPALFRGELDEALARLERTHRLCEAKGILFFLSVSSICMGNALARSGRSEEALAAYDRGMSLHQALGMKSWASRLLELWGEGLLHVGRLAEARRVGDQALDLSRTHGEAGCEAAVLVLLGDIALAQDPADVGGAAGTYTEALTLGSRLGMRPLVAHCHLGLGKLYRRTGRRQEAQEHLTTATTMYREMDMRFWLEQAEADGDT